MKKSIKYAGIAAATLLAVAPVAAPVVSTVTTAQAAVSDADATAVQKEINDFKGQFGDVDYDSTDATGTASAITALSAYFGVDHATNIATVQSAAASQAKFMKSPLTDISNKNLTDLNTLVYFTATDATGKTYNGQSVGQKPADINAALKSDSRLPMTINVHFKSADLDSVLSTYKDFSFKINKTDDNELKTIQAQFTTPVSVAKNSKVNDTQLVNTNDVVIKDQDGNSLSVNNVQFGQTYYSTYSAAIAAAQDPTFDASAVGAEDQLNGDIKGGEFKTAGTYYQTVTYTANTNSALDSFLAAYKTQATVDPDYTVYVNGKNAVSGVDFASTAADTTANPAKKATITFVRAINVSDNDSQWTTSSVDGVVTTKSTKDYYTLVNTDGNQIKNRALAKNTAWKTDKVRTDQNGNKQYRVASDEWIDANDVTFGDSATTDTGALTDIQSVTGTVNLENASMVYFLYNKAGEQVKNRALSGNSAWKVINTAKDADGNTYYRVATDEWVMQGTGVSFN